MRPRRLGPSLAGGLAAGAPLVLFFRLWMSLSCHCLPTDFQKCSPRICTHLSSARESLFPCRFWGGQRTSPGRGKCPSDRVPVA